MPNICRYRPDYRVVAPEHTECDVMILADWGGYVEYEDHLEAMQAAHAEIASLREQLESVGAGGVGALMPSPIRSDIVVTAALAALFIVHHLDDDQSGLPMDWPAMHKWLKTNVTNRSPTLDKSVAPFRIIRAAMKEQS